MIRALVCDTETGLCTECRVQLHIDENALEFYASLYALNLITFANK